MKHPGTAKFWSSFCVIRSGRVMQISLFPHWQQACESCKSLEPRAKSQLL
jgi:hypothetical protein